MIFIHILFICTKPFNNTEGNYILDENDDDDDGGGGGGGGGGGDKRGLNL
jgi:hypothetical protein